MSKKERYFMKQKLIGLAMILMGVITTIISGGDITSLVLVGPIGIMLLTTKRMIFADSYYYEVVERRRLRREK